MDPSPGGSGVHLSWFQQVNVNHGSVSCVSSISEKDTSKRQLMSSPEMEGELSSGGSWFSPRSIEAGSRLRRGPFKAHLDSSDQK